MSTQTNVLTWETIIERTEMICQQDDIFDINKILKNVVFKASIELINEAKEEGRPYNAITLPWAYLEDQGQTVGLNLNRKFMVAMFGKDRILGMYEKVKKESDDVETKQKCQIAIEMFEEEKDD